MTVSAEQRAALGRAVSGLRRLFEADYAALAEGKFGIHLAGRRAGEVEDATALSLSAHDLAARRELVGVVEYLRGEGLGASEAVERLVREAVFTTVNRLLAIRVAEAVDVLSPSLIEGNRSQGFAEAVEAFPLLRDADDSGGYWTYLQICGDELSHAVPRLFDRRHPLSALVPSAEALEDAVGILTDPPLKAVWVEPEALGWSYQFFNSQDERRSMREASSAPRDSRELAVRNQFFTPGYVVDFLVQNTLGRRLRESGFGLALPLLLGDVDQGATSLDLDEVAVLDPAVGSGHFLLGAYDLLERAWEERGVSPAEAAPRIVGSLHGIEIDPRAAQVAQAVIYLRARRSSASEHVEAPAIVTARPLPRDSETRREVLSSQPSIVHDLLGELSTALESAPDLGSLLKVEDVVGGALGERVRKPQLGDDLAESIESVEAAVVQAATVIAHQADASPAERMFAAEAADALRFVEACTRRYDAVLMNPPFGEPIPGTKEYIKAAWPWIPWKDYNLLAAFVGRGLELAKSDGYVGAITSRGGFFLSTFEEWRRQVVLGNGLAAFVDLGFGVMEEATVEAAAYVLGRRPTTESSFVRLLREDDKANALAIAIDRVQRGELVDFVDVVSLDELRAIPGLRFNYWLPNELRRLYIDLPSLGGEDTTEVRVGLQTSDDFRFLRAHWEVRPDLIAKSLSATRSGRRWVLLAKGGEYSPYYTDHHLVVDWLNEGEPIRSFPKSVIRNEGFYFQPGLTWPERTNSAFGPQILPAGAIFSVKGPLMWASEESQRLPLLAWTNSRIVRVLIEASVASGEETRTGGVPSRDYSVGLIADLPSPLARLRPRDRDALESAMEELLSSVRRLWNSDETTRFFECPDAVRYRSDPITGRIEVIARGREEEVLRVLELHADVERLLHGALGVAEDLAVLDDVAGPQRARLPDRELSDAERQLALSLLARPVSDAIDASTAKHGKRRFVQLNYHVVDRLVETMAYVLGVHPRTIVEERRRAAILPAGLAEGVASDLMSWLVGAAFGRFDLRVDAIEERAKDVGGLFDPVSDRSPGMRTEGEASAEDPLPTPGSGILVDDQGSPVDIVTMVEEAAGEVFDDPHEELRWALKQVGEGDLRSYLRSSFFGHHVVRYTKSRRKAPIYWYLAIPSQRWGLWVYAPWLSREQLFAISQIAQEKLRRLSDQASQLRRELEDGANREARTRLEEADVLIGELEAFREKAEAVAQSGWEPDLNDGIILNAAPLEELFADAKWRKDVSTHRQKMESGEYSWATVQRQYFDRLRS